MRALSRRPAPRPLGRGARRPSRQPRPPRSPARHRRWQLCTTTRRPLSANRGLVFVAANFECDDHICSVAHCSSCVWSAITLGICTIMPPPGYRTAAATPVGKAVPALAKGCCCMGHLFIYCSKISPVGAGEQQQPTASWSPD